MYPDGLLIITMLSPFIFIGYGLETLAVWAVVKIIERILKHGR